MHSSCQHNREQDCPRHARMFPPSPAVVNIHRHEGHLPAQRLGWWCARICCEPGLNAQHVQAKRDNQHVPIMTDLPSVQACTGPARRACRWPGRCSCWILRMHERMQPMIR